LFWHLSYTIQNGRGDLYGEGRWGREIQSLVGFDWKIVHTLGDKHQKIASPTSNPNA